MREDRLTKGNAFEPEYFGADGVIAFVNAGYTESSSSYERFANSKDDSTNVVLYTYNTEEHPSPHLNEYAQIVGNALSILADQGVKIVIMPPLNGDGGSPEDKIKALESGVAEWLKANSSSSIERVFITSI